jgi:hypothetical protein
MIELNNWSHGLYYYIAASAHIALYRDSVNNTEAAVSHTFHFLFLQTHLRSQATHKKKAEEYIKTSKQHLGKKRIMARQMPFDVFVGRKVAKWEQRATESNIDLVDAVGVSPIVEMIYFWNGFKRMLPDDLETSIEKLDWSKEHAKIPLEKDTDDERAIYAVLKAVVLRNLGKTEEARSLLKTDVVEKDRNVLKGGFKDNWTCPVAHYEMGVTYWRDYEKSMSEQDLVDSASWLEKTAGWESYDLDAR